MTRIEEIKALAQIMEERSLVYIKAGDIELHAAPYGVSAPGQAAEPTELEKRLEREPIEDTSDPYAGLPSLIKTPAGRKVA